METPDTFCSTASAESQFPRLVTPAAGPASAGGLERLARHRGWLRERLVADGALLFRGFDVSSAGALDAVTSAAGFELTDYRRGITPRHAVRGRVYTATDAPPAFPIPLHNEMSYTSIYPRFLALCCQRPPRRGGRTPIGDMAAVLERLPADLVERCESRGLLYRQRVPSAASRPRRKSWQQMFDTEQTAVVERACREQGVGFHWEGDVLRLEGRRPAVLTYPTTGRRVWFNQIQVFHPSFSDEVWHHRKPLLALAFRAYESLGRLTSRPSEIDCRYGDGTPIARGDVRAIRRALWAAQVRFEWQRGDLLLLDNLRVAHGREPYRGERSVLASLIAGDLPVSSTARTATASRRRPGASHRASSRPSDRRAADGRW